jgi:hypothetical protein
MAAAAFPRCVPVCRMRRRLSLSGLPNESGNLRRLLVSMGNRNHPVRRTSGLAPALDMAAAHRPGGMKPPRFEVLTDLKRMWNVPAWKRWRMVCMRKRTGVQGACRRGKGDFRARNGLFPESRHTSPLPNAATSGEAVPMRLADANCGKSEVIRSRFSRFLRDLSYLRFTHIRNFRGRGKGTSLFLLQGESLCGELSDRPLPRTFHPNRSRPRSIQRTIFRGGSLFVIARRNPPPIAFECPLRPIGLE